MKAACRHFLPHQPGTTNVPAFLGLSYPYSRKIIVGSGSQHLDVLRSFTVTMLQSEKFSRRLLVIAFVMCLGQLQAFQPPIVSRQRLQRRQRSSQLRVAATLSRNDTIARSTTATSDSQVAPLVSPIAASSSITSEMTDSSPTTPPGLPVVDTNSTTTSSRSSNPVALIDSTNDLLNFMVGGREDDQLTVVKYYAHYCKICQRAGIQLKKVASEYPDVRFGKVESMVFPDSAQTLRSLGVSKFPFVQIYRRGQCVASFSTGPSHLFVKKIRDTIDICRNRTPEEWDAFTTEFSNEIESNRQARENLSLLK